MKTRKFLLSIIVIMHLITGCEKDNYDAPGSFLKGRVVYNNQSVGVRSNAIQLELWQHGYDNFVKIPVYVNQDGTFSASLFDGNYKLVRMAGAPWEVNTDSIDVVVKSETIIDVPVVPYFNIENVSYQRNGNEITATFTISKVSNQGTLNRVRLFLGNNNLTDNGYNIASVNLNASAITLGTPTTITATIPASVDNGFVFARIGVETSGIGQLLYAPSEKIPLN